MIGEFE